VEHDQPHTAEDAVADPLGDLVVDLIVREVAPPEQHVGVVQDGRGETMLGLFQGRRPARLRAGPVHGPAVRHLVGSRRAQARIDVGIRGGPFGGQERTPGDAGATDRQRQPPPLRRLVGGRGVPAGIRWAGDPATAAAVTRRLAAITNAEVGIDGAAAFAAAIAVVVGGGDLEAAVGAARGEIGAATWLSRMMGTAERILEEEGSLFAAIPAFNDDVANRTYSFGNVVAETLPLALLIARRCSGLEHGLAVAALIPKQADTLPAMVGALLGGASGATAIPRSWSSRVEKLTGVCVPSTRGARLRDLAAALLAPRSSELHEAVPSRADHAE